MMVCVSRSRAGCPCPRRSSARTKRTASVPVSPASNSCAEIIVVDSGSTDATLTIVRDFIARGWPIKLIERDWPGYAKQKQFALEQATQPWVLSIDADEWLDDELRGDLPRLLQAPRRRRAGSCNAP